MMYNTSFLETGFWEPALYNNSVKGRPNPNLNNSRHFVTSYNGAGRCFPVNKGQQGTQKGDLPPKDAGGACSNNYFVDDGQPHIYAAVVDRRGATVYRDPVWPGLAPTTADAVLAHAHPPEPPADLQPPCEVGSSCALNTPSCLLKGSTPDGQTSCADSVADPLKEWGFEPCSAPPLGGGSALEATTTPAAQPSGGGLGLGSGEATGDVAAAVPPPPPLTCCQVGNTTSNALAVANNRALGLEPSLTCIDVDATIWSGKVCHDPLCEKATTPSACTSTTDSRGGKCVWDPPPAGSPAATCGTNTIPQDLVRTLQ